MGNLYYFPSFWATDNLDLMKWTNLREGFIIFSKTVKVTPVSKVTPNNGTHVYVTLGIWGLSLGEIDQNFKGPH